MYILHIICVHTDICIHRARDKYVCKYIGNFICICVCVCYTLFSLDSACALNNVSVNRNVIGNKVVFCSVLWTIYVNICNMDIYIYSVKCMMWTYTYLCEMLCKNTCTIQEIIYYIHVNIHTNVGIR